MTDQANAQSGGDTAVRTEADLTALIKSSLVASTEPAGQPETTGEPNVDPAADAGGLDGQDDQQSAVLRFKVPALEGDGFEELTAEQIRAERLMQRDYTRKTQEVAEDRRKVAELKAETERAASARLEQLDHDLQAAGNLIRSFEQTVDWQALQEHDPAEYIRQREAQHQRIKAWEQSRKKIDSVRAEQRAALRKEQAAKLVEAVPEWLDQSRADADAKRIIDGAQAYRLTAEDIANLDDHRLIMALNDATKYREMLARSKGVKQEVLKAPAMAKPGTSQQGNPKALAQNRAVQAAMKEGTQKSLQNAFAKFL